MTNGGVGNDTPFSFCHFGQSEKSDSVLKAKNKILPFPFTMFRASVHQNDNNQWIPAFAGMTMEGRE
jgi:hypothetical protein